MVPPGYTKTYSGTTETANSVHLLGDVGLVPRRRASMPVNPSERASEPVVTQNRLAINAESATRCADRSGARIIGTTGILRLEATLVVVVALFGYHALGGNWLAFVLLFLVPDVTMAGYLRSPETGAAVYNAGHTYLLPAALALIGWVTGAPLLEQLAMIWAAHIGFDRLLLYGLKYPTGFADSHLGRLGSPKGLRVDTTTIRNSVSPCDGHTN
jgi:Domain of unknown function (DUF4260)